MEEFFSPVDDFRGQLKEKFGEQARTTLEELIRRSGVDEKANVKTVKEIRLEEKKIIRMDSRRNRWNGLRIFLWILSIVSAVVGILWILRMIWPEDVPEIPFYFGIPALILPVLLLTLVFRKLNPMIRDYDQKIAAMKKHVEELTEEAWAQMEPLLSLFDWDTVTKIMEKTVPGLTFDPFFTRKRLSQLHEKYGLNGDLFRNSSVISCQSGSLNGHPFAIAETVEMQMGEKTYTGTLLITWREKETYSDANGKLRTRWVTRTETLVATVDKPCPVYPHETFLLYGASAAGKLTFSRMPSELSSAGNGFFDKRKIQSAIDELKEKSREMKGFMIMSNEKFDALFHAVNRSSETDFRLLFTPLAQQEMVKLLQDNREGYGDDFAFEKQGGINIVTPAHLDETPIDANPSLFRHFELAEIRKMFLDFACEYFRSLYFAFAPLCTIPLYTENETEESDPEYAPSLWEYESLANTHGDTCFRHPASVTENILKTEEILSGEDGREVVVTAYGFRGMDRTDFVTKFGGDGCWHEVPVHWVEYIPVQKSGKMFVKEDLSLANGQLPEGSVWKDFFRKSALAPEEMLFRRKTVSFVKAQPSR